MQNIITGIYITPPPQNSTMKISVNNFGYSAYFYPNSRSKTKLEFTCYTNCRETLNYSRSFMHSATITLEKFLSFEPDEKPFFYCPGIPIDIVASVFENIENKIGISSQAKFQETDEPGFLAIFPGRFWGGVAGRFGLFTCLLRACCRTIFATDYKSIDWKKSIDELIQKSIDNDKYLLETKDSVKNFMSGKTFIVPIGMSADWYAWMNSKNEYLQNPILFTHDQYISHVKNYACQVWEYNKKPSNRDIDIWSAAERYAALNSCR